MRPAVTKKVQAVPRILAMHAHRIASNEANALAVDGSSWGRLMTTLEAVAFGAMLAWTPSLMILAASLWDVRELKGME